MPKKTSTSTSSSTSASTSTGTNDVADKEPVPSVPVPKKTSTSTSTTTSTSTATGNDDLADEEPVPSVPAPKKTTTSTSTATGNDDLADEEPVASVPAPKKTSTSTATGTDDVRIEPPVIKAKEEEEAFDESSATNSAALGLLKSLIEKAAAGTLNKTTEQSKATAKDIEALLVDVQATSMKPADRKPSGTFNKIVTKCFSNEMKVNVAAAGSSEDSLDYWSSEKKKMEQKASYLTFHQDAQLKKNLTSKSTSPPPQTISTQVASHFIYLVLLFIKNAFDSS